jgi:hypothetical protein
MRFDIRKHLFASTTTSLLLLVVVGAIGWYSLRRLSADFNALFNENVRATVQLAATEGAMWELRFGLPQYMLQDEAGRRKLRQATPKWFEVVRRNIDEYARGNRSAEELQALASWRTAFTRYADARPHFFDLWDAGQNEEATAFRMKVTNPAAAEAVKALKALILLQEQLAARKQEAQLRSVRNAKVALGTAFILSVAVAGAMFVVVSRVRSNLTRLRLRPTRCIPVGLEHRA